uniref:Chromo domain-containing protein n=1 Tax=Caenorhabditis tropicalis TaxID=1561998 RepID=A0A1I7TN95_9PELO
MGKGSVKSAKQKNKADEEYDVEKILQSRKNGAEYLVKWKNYGAKHNSWIKKTWLNCPLKLKEFEKEEANRKRAERKRRADSSRQHSTPQEEGTDDDDDQEDWEVEKIVDSRNNEEEYFVKWKGFGAEHNSWVEKSDLNCPIKIEEYKKRELERNRRNGNGSVQELAPQTGQNPRPLFRPKLMTNNILKNVYGISIYDRDLANIYYNVEATDGTKGLKTSAWMKKNAPMLLIEYYDRVGRESIEQNDSETEPS